MAGLRTHFVKDGDSYVLTGTEALDHKRRSRQLHTVLATSDTRRKIDLKARNRKIAAFVVDRDTPGVKVGKKKTRWASAPATPPTSSSTRCGYKKKRLGRKAKASRSR